MASHAGRRGKAAPVAVLLFGLILLTVGVAGLVDASTGSRASSVASSMSSPESREAGRAALLNHPGAGPAPRRPGRPARLGRPTTLQIPSIGVETAIEDLRTTPSGELEVPTDPARVGWWADGAKPGQQGPAVLVGHRDSLAGPAVFYGLGELTAGDAIVVRDAAGNRWVFSVTAIEQVRKADFPTRDVYGPTRHSELRLLTCAGDFETAQYEDNLVVYAELTDG
jgi:sortase (surface protein transpeptidase)